MSYERAPSYHHGGDPIRRVDTSRRAPMSGVPLGAECGPCYIASGSDCEICPDGAGDDFPECSGCVNGARATVLSKAEESLLLPVVAGVLSALLVAYFSAKFLRESRVA